MFILVCYVNSSSYNVTQREGEKSVWSHNSVLVEELESSLLGRSDRGNRGSGGMDREKKEKKRSGLAQTV